MSGTLTGSRALRGLLSPAALTLSAAWRISAGSVMCLSSNGRRDDRSPGYPGQAEARGGDELPLHLVDPAAEGQHGVPLGLDVEPLDQGRGAGVGRVAVPADELF